MTTPSQYEEFRERIRANWNDEKTASAWRRWHTKIAHQMRAVNASLLEAAQIRRGMRVLDLASGSGEPALQIAHAVAPTGSAVATDISAGMLDVARENARSHDLRNITFVQCDAEHLPFDDGSFDAVTSRMGVMFLVDLPGALRQIHRVLRQGTYAAFAVWGPMEGTTMFNAVLRPFIERAEEAPAPPPGAPHPFRFSRPGSLAEELRAADFEDVEEAVCDFATPWPGPPQEMWQMFYEIAGPAFIDDMPDAKRDGALREAIENLQPLFNGSSICARSAVIIARGRKAS